MNTIDQTAQRNMSNSHLKHDSMFSSSSRRRRRSCSNDTSKNSCVHFASPVVSSINFRPCTSRKERSDFYYTNRETKRFKKEHRLHKIGCKDCDKGIGYCFSRSVRFPPVIVTDIHYCSPITKDDLSLLYYSEAEIEGFMFEVFSALSYDENDLSACEMDKTDNLFGINTSVKAADDTQCHITPWSNVIEFDEADNKIFRFLNLVEPIPVFTRRLFINAESFIPKSSGIS